MGPIAQAYDQAGHLLQILGEAPDVPGFYILAGGMLFTLGTLYARLVAELIARGSAALPISIHDPARFTKNASARQPQASSHTLIRSRRNQRA